MSLVLGCEDRDLEDKLSKVSGNSSREHESCKELHDFAIDH